MDRENFEWIHSWCDNVLDNSLPRVLLIGDSITHGYQELVREKLRGKCYVDYLSSSYAVDNPFLHTLTEGFVKTNPYALIHCNNGLHGRYMAAEVYAAGMTELVTMLLKYGKTILATSTYVYDKELTGPHPLFDIVVPERNRIVQKIAKEYNCPVDDLYTVSSQLEKTFYSADGTHLKSEGYTILANAVASSILQNLL